MKTAKKIIWGRFLKFIIVAISVIAIGTVKYVDAAPISVPATSDTYITENGGLGGTSSIHGSDISLWLTKGKVTDQYRSFPIVKFDLSEFSGWIVNGPTVEFRLELIGSWSNTIVTQSVSVREVKTDWKEEDASFSNFGGSGFNEATHTGVNLTTRNVTFNGQTESVTFSIPSNLVQGWIDGTTPNNGLILISNTAVNHTDLLFASRERGASATFP